ncbi:outer membrane protein assembly factor BamB family protein [Natronorubrum thiooxidans]|uniref:Outer membrane protein assembly factor BamB, contains PQQ-like beta-propeller repeat n=1 Tax=Natronorubrum thiooxidans TaxID=308853 RepID=A0A1N7EVA6_9EURY|nr:PQQ-binding-like beta-propeller repeat protein [Natronorubrum thiooxidans]SIR92013.1 Outer membrane protein assembly factor BamB, contains PQQ-like beta-propeller repeat [Natronorubrum thiooxidans]
MKYSRRQLLSASTAAAATAGAGCVSLLDGNETNDGGEGENETDGNTDVSSSSGVEIPADDWPSFQRSPRNDGYTTSMAPTAEPSTRWETTLSGAIDDQVAVVDDTVYVATDAGTVHALDAASGDERWSESLEGGRSQCPCIVDGLVVLGTNTGELVALDADDGERAWTTELAGPVRGPTAADGTVYVGTRDDPVAYAIDGASGDEVWSTALAVDAIDYPAVTEDAVYMGAQYAWDGRVSALDLTNGTQQWEFEGARMQSPTVAESGVLAPATTISVLTAAGDNDESTHRQIGLTGKVLASPAVTPELVVYSTSQGFVGAVEHSRDESDLGWGTSVGRFGVYAPAVTDKAVYVTRIGSELLALDIETGDELWTRSLEDGGVTAPTVADGAVFVGTDEGRLVAFD